MPTSPRLRGRSRSAWSTVHRRGRVPWSFGYPQRRGEGPALSPLKGGAGVFKCFLNIHLSSNPHREAAVDGERFPGYIIVGYQLHDQRSDLVRGALTVKRDALLQV